LPRGSISSAGTFRPLNGLVRERYSPGRINLEQAIQ
jgi:hypothetical protein